MTPANPSAPAEAAVEPGTLVRDYEPSDGVFDEMMAPEGRVRPHWRKFLAGLEELAEGELARRWEAAQRLIHENGITYNVYGDPRGMARPWELDAIPLLVGQDEWRQIEAGLIQRAKVLNAVLADLYGPQILLRDGVLPAALVYGNPQFLRPCHGVAVPGDTYLHLYAADLARAPDGRWWVLSDRTQAPSGAGYALENRIILSRSLPDLFHDCAVERLASFFNAMRDNLLKLARRDEPRAVLLTPGPFNETYFEHAYLARYLGFTLVEGADLTVRDDRVFLKTLDGLQQVDLIVRRLDAEYCDPLELRADSSLGVAGLVQAVKAGNVVVANALGSGLVECEGLMGFLPNLCRRLFGEELAIPCIATWWCGHEDARAYVLDNLDGLVINPTFQSRPMLSTAVEPVLGATLSPAERRALAERMAVRGYDYIGQELVALSTAPVWRDGALKPAPMALRVYVAAVDDDYVVMPGGLTRVSASDDARAVSMQRGDGSKDTWVVSRGSVSSFSLLRAPDQPVQLRRSARALPSRAADNLFWLGRYAERAESTVRLLRSVAVRLGENSTPGDGWPALERLLEVLSDEPTRPALEDGEDDTFDLLESLLLRWIYDASAPFSLRSNLDHLHRTASLARDRLSLDAWRILNRFQMEPVWRQPHEVLEVGRTLDLLNDSIRTLSAFSGMEMENMTRNLGWRMLDMGRRLERAGHMVELLRVLLADGDPETDGRLELLLELADSFMTYRSRYFATPQIAPVLDLLLVDESNPRSIGFQMAAAAAHIEALPREDDTPVLSGHRRIATGTATALRLADIHALCRADESGRRHDLDALLTRLAMDFPAISDSIARSYFSHVDGTGLDERYRRGLAP